MGPFHPGLGDIPPNELQEHVTEDRAANMRVRKVVVLYYLEDDTLQISEPKQDNSGLPQVWSTTLRCTYLCQE